MVSTGAIRHSKSAEWHSSYAKWHPARPSYTHAIPCNFAFLDFFLGPFNTQIFFFFFKVKLGHSNMPNSFVLKNHRFHHCFQKLIKSRFFPRLMNSCSKLGALAHVSFIFKRKRKKRTPSSFFFFFQKNSSSRFPKNHAFILN